MTVRLDLPDRRRPWSAEDAHGVAEGARDRIVQRTRQGLDVDGQPFPRREDGSPSRLEESGELLDGIVAHVDGGQAVVRSTAPHSSHVEAGGRRFMGLTADEEAEVAERLHQLIADALSGRL